MQTLITIRTLRIMHEQLTLARLEAIGNPDEILAIDNQVFNILLLIRLLERSPEKQWVN
jgi:hypothetical protein